MLFTGSSYPLANQYSMSVFWANLMSKKIPIVLHLTILLMLLFFGLPAAKAQQRRQVIIDHAGEMRNLLQWLKRNRCVSIAVLYVNLS
jgi:hypothetical protein